MNFGVFNSLLCSSTEYTVCCTAEHTECSTLEDVKYSKAHSVQWSEAGPPIRVNPQSSCMGAGPHQFITWARAADKQKEGESRQEGVINAAGAAFTGTDPL